MKLKKGSKRYIFFKVTEEDGGTITVNSATATFKDKGYNTLASPTPVIRNNGTAEVTIVVMCDTTITTVSADNQYFIVATFTIGAEIFIEQETIDVVQ